MSEKVRIEADRIYGLITGLAGKRDAAAADVVEEVLGMELNLSLGTGEVIDLLLHRSLACDRPVLVSRENPDVIVDVGLDVAHGKVVTDVAVELPVIGIAGVAVGIGPDQIRK